MTPKHWSHLSEALESEKSKVEKLTLCNIHIDDENVETFCKVASQVTFNIIWGFRTFFDVNDWLFFRLARYIFQAWGTVVITQLIQIFQICRKIFGCIFKKNFKFRLIIVLINLQEHLSIVKSGGRNFNLQAFHLSDGSRTAHSLLETDFYLSDIMGVDDTI